MCSYIQVGSSHYHHFKLPVVLQQFISLPTLLDNIHIIFDQTPMINHISENSIIFQGYRVQIFQTDNKQLELTIIDPCFRRRYELKASESDLGKINAHTIRAGFEKKSKDIRMELVEGEGELEIRVEIAIPLLPSITQIIKCPLSKEITECQSNFIRLEEAKKKLLNTQLVTKKAVEASKEERNLVSCVQRAAQPYDEYGNYTESSQSYDGSYATVILGNLLLQKSTEYLLTMSFFVKNVNNLTIYFGDESYSNPSLIFGDGSNSIFLSNQDKTVFVPHTLRKTIQSFSTQKQIFFTYDNCCGTEFRNIVVTAEKLVKPQ